MKKRLLLVTYQFPPILSAGVSRVVGIARYLHENGWEISVLTVERSHTEISDPVTLNKIPRGIKVTRTKSWEIDGIVSRLYSGANEAAAGEARSKPDRRGKNLATRLTGLCKAPFRLLYSAACFPDRKVGWLFPLFSSLWRVIRKNGIDLVLSSSPPHSCHLSILALRKIRPFKWIVDFRDPWTAPPYHYQSKLSLFIARCLEKAVLQSCDRIIANTNGNKDALLRTFPSINESKIVVITNGYDVREDIGECGVSEEDVDCDLVYTGEIYKGMLDLYLRSIEVLIEKKRPSIPRLFVYGYIDENDLDEIKRSIAREYILYRGLVSWDKSVRIMQKARALLLLLPHSERGRTWVPSKIYPYVFSGRPVLVVAPEGDATRIVEETGAGVTVKSSIPEKVAEEIEAFTDSLRSGELSLSRREAKLKTYTMENVSSRVERVLNEEASR